jgi:hypothetical protein
MITGLSWYSFSSSSLKHLMVSEYAFLILFSVTFSIPLVGFEGFVDCQNGIL